MSPIFQIYDGKDYIAPISVDFAEGESTLNLKYSNGPVATLLVEPNEVYIKFTLLSLSNRETIKSVVWGPYVTSITKHIGETIFFCTSI